MEQQLGRRFFLDKRYKNKKIVIYGASQTGKTLYKQILDRNFAQVVAFADQQGGKIKAYLQNDDINCEVYKPEWLFEKKGYDFIFLATSNRETKNVMTDYLTNHEIENDRIIFLEESFYDGEQEYRMIDDVDTAVRQLVKADENLKKGEVELSVQFYYWMKLYFSLLSEKEKFIARIKCEFNHYPSLDTRIMLGKYLFELQALDAVDMEKLMRSINELPEEQYEWAYMLFGNTAYMELNQKKILYKDLGKDRRKLGEKIVDYYCSRKQYDFGDHRENPDRVAMLVPALLDQNSASSMVWREVANTLSRKGKKIHMFIIFPPAEQCFGFLSTSEDYYRIPTKVNLKKNRKWLDDEVKYECVEEHTAKDLLDQVIIRVNEFQPGCIIDATDELCPVSAILYQHYPVFNYPVRTCTSSSFFHKTMMCSFEYNREIDSYRVELPLLEVKKEATVVYNKEEKLQIPEDSFVLITPGTRLGMEITSSLVDIIMPLLEKKRDMYWVLVGDTSVSKHFSADMAAYDKVRILPFEEDLVALYHLCDVYLNPDRMGGGFSMVSAMQEGVAVASLNIGAASNWIDRHWLVEGSYKELCEYIEKLYEDHEILVRTKQEMQLNIEKKHPHEEWAEVLYQIVEEVSKMEIRDFYFEI